MKLTTRAFGFQFLGTALLAIGTVLPAWADYESTVLSQGPVGYWRLNETTQPQPVAPAANLGSLGASASGAYNSYPERGVPGPFAGLSVVLPVPSRAARRSASMGRPLPSLLRGRRG
jgi:hypothetical protein